jgi:hypothetical protein
MGAGPVPLVRKTFKLYALLIIIQHNQGRKKRLMGIAKRYEMRSSVRVVQQERGTLNFVNNNHADGMGYLTNTGQKRETGRRI